MSKRKIKKSKAVKRAKSVKKPAVMPKPEPTLTIGSILHPDPPPLPNLPKRPGAHSDKLCRKYISNPPFAAEVIKHYTDPVFYQHVDIAALQSAPTNFITKELRERIKDVAFVAALLDKTNNTEILFTFEAKSHQRFGLGQRHWCGFRRAL